LGYPNLFVSLPSLKIIIFIFSWLKNLPPKTLAKQVAKCGHDDK